MPVQKTFTLIPAAPSRDVSPAIPAAGRPPIMTSKQVKAAHKAANKAPKLSRAEQRQLEKAEQARIRKEFEKEKAAAKARLLRDKKKDKEDAEKAEKKKKGLPTVKIRPSQGMIAGWVRGKKRDSEGSVVENTKILEAEKKGQDKVLVAVMEEDERRSKEASPVVEEQIGQLEATAIPNRNPHTTTSTDTGSLPPDDLAGIMPQAEDLGPSQDHFNLALKSQEERGRVSLHKPSKDATTTLIIDPPPESLCLNVDDLDPAILEDWIPSTESDKRPPPTNLHAFDLGLPSPPRRRGSSQEHNERPSKRPVRQCSSGRHRVHSDQSPENALDNRICTNAPGPSANTIIERTACDRSSHTTSQQPEQPVQYVQDRAPHTPRVGQTRPPNGPPSTTHEASIVEILSGDFDFDDDLLEELAPTRSVVTLERVVEVPAVSLRLGEDAFDICSQDFKDVDVLEALHVPTHGVQLKDKEPQESRQACFAKNKPQESASSDDYGDLDDDITLSQLPPITPCPHPPVTTSVQQATATARKLGPTTPIAGSSRRPMDPPQLPRSVASKTSDVSPAQQLPPPSTQAIMLNPEDFFPTLSQQALELEDGSPQLPERASATTSKAVAAPSFAIPAQPDSRKRQKPSPQQAPPPPSSPPPRFFTSSGSRSRHSLKMLQERRAKDREELRKMEERRIEKGRVEAEKRRLERAQRRQDEERWKQNHEQKCRKEEAKKLQPQRAHQRPPDIHAGILNKSTRPAMSGLLDKENVNPVGKVQGWRELDNGIITGSMINELVSASQESFGGDWVDDLEVDLTIP